MKRIVLASFLTVSLVASPAYSIVNPFSMARNAIYSLYSGVCGIFGMLTRSRVAAPADDDGEIEMLDEDESGRLTTTTVKITGAAAQVSVPGAGAGSL